MTDLERAIRRLRRKHSVPRLAYRYVAGRPLDGRDGYPYRQRGAGRWAGWQRQAARLGVPAADAVVILPGAEPALSASRL